MSQPATWGVATVGPKTPTAMAQDMKASLDGLLSCHSDATAPAYRVTGTIWCDTATANRLIYKVWDGSEWVVFLTINTATDAARLASINPATTLASAATATLAGVESDVIEITGTTGVTSFGAAGAGLLRFVRFAGALLLTHSAALQLPAATNRTTAAGDSLVAISLGSGNWRVLSYTPATITVGLTATRSVTSASSAGDRAFTAADAGRTILLGGSLNFTMTFDPAATLGNGWAADVKCTTSVIVTLDPNGSETIDGSTTITLARGQQCRIVCDGSGLHTIGLERTVTLYDETAPSAVSSIVVELPLGYRRFEVFSTLLASLDGNIIAQLSNDGGATYQTSGYTGGGVFGTSAPSSAGFAGPTNGMIAGYAIAANPSYASSVFDVSNVAFGNCMQSHAGYYAAGFHVKYDATGMYNAVLADVNRMRLVQSAGGTLSSGTRITVRGLR